MNVQFKNLIWLIIGMVGLLLVYLLQQEIAQMAKSWTSGFTAFALGRAIRFILNDIFALMIIYALFPHRKYLVFAIYVQLAGIVLILIPYLILKYNMPGYNGPLINFLHRLVLNPLLLLLLIPAFFYQQQFQKDRQKHK